MKVNPALALKACLFRVNASNPTSINVFDYLTGTYAGTPGTAGTAKVGPCTVDFGASSYITCGNNAALTLSVSFPVGCASWRWDFVCSLASAPLVATGKGRPEISSHTLKPMLNRGYAYTSIIRSRDYGQTLLSHLASHYPHSSLQAWQHNLSKGEVTVDGVTSTGKEWVSSGQTLVWNRPPWIEPNAPQHFQVLFEDAHLLAVNKPSGLPTLPGGGFMENTLLRLVQKETPHANPVHRLGRATTGIVLFAKTPQAASQLSADWNTPRIEKIYRGLAQNVAEHDAYEILAPIGLMPHPLIGSVWAANPDGKPSKSVATVISRTPKTTIFEVSLHSGRPHQIRIHLASIGHPLVGDPLYGSSGQPLEDLPGLPGDGGYLLHAQSLQFDHPITREQVHLEAALPSTFSLHP